MSAALVGLHENENLFVSARNRWEARYIPACIRRYPFVFVKVAQKEPRKFALCIDEAYAGCNTQGDGENLFDSNAKETGYLKRMVKLPVTMSVSSPRRKPSASDCGSRHPGAPSGSPLCRLMDKTINGLLVVKKDPRRRCRAGNCRNRPIAVLRESTPSSCRWKSPIACLAAVHPLI
jgi:hypothetical protein